MRFLILFLIAILSWSSSAQINAQMQICGSKQPIQELVEYYQIHELSGKFSRLTQLDDLYPLVDSNKIFQVLQKQYLVFLQAYDSIDQLKEIFSKIPPQKRSNLDTVLNQYISTYKNEKLLIEEKLTYSNDPNKYESRPELVSRMKSKLTDQSGPHSA